MVNLHKITRISDCLTNRAHKDVFLDIEDHQRTMEGRRHKENRSSREAPSTPDRYVLFRGIKKCCEISFRMSEDNLDT